MPIEFTDMEFHSLANIFPLMDGHAFDDLTADIEKNGQLMPIYTYQGQIIDGRNRYHACRRLGIDPKYIEYPGDENGLAEFVVSLNLKRRHLNESQRAMVAAALANMERGRPKESDEISTFSQPEAAKLLNVHRTSVIHAKAVRDAGSPELVAAVEYGSVAVSTAAEIARSVPAEEQSAIVARGEKEIIQRANEIKRQRKIVRQKQKLAEVKERAADAAKAVPVDDHLNIFHGDFREISKDIPDASVDLIFTDPPYDRETLPLYGDMASIAARILKPGGSLVCYLGQYQIHQVCSLVTPHLRIWWTLACVHSGRSARMFEYGVVVKWKPLLWFVNGTRGDKETFIDDMIVSQEEKDHHEWQQSEVEAKYYIEKLCPPGGVVFDPFCGGGTTAVACKRTGRQWLTCDIDESYVRIARKRVYDQEV